MIYRVTAHFMPERADEYLTILSDGTIKSQSPDDGEIVDAMNRAVVTVTVGDWYMQIIRGGSVLDADYHVIRVSFARRSTLYSAASSLNILSCFLYF